MQGAVSGFGTYSIHGTRKSAYWNGRRGYETDDSD